MTPPAKQLQFECDNLNSKGFVNVSVTVFICSLMKKTFECIIDRAVGTCLQVAFAWVPICIGEMAVFIITKPLLFLSSKRCHAQSWVVLPEASHCDSAQIFKHG